MHPICENSEKAWKMFVLDSLKMSIWAAWGWKPPGSFSVQWLLFFAMWSKSKVATKTVPLTVCGGGIELTHARQLLFYQVISSD